MDRTLIIAEIGVNHQGSIPRAKVLIEQARLCNADTVKFQLYDVDKLFPDKKIMAQGRNWYSEVKQTQLNKEQVFELAEHSKRIGMTFSASCFDLERLGWLEELDVPFHKVASRMKHNKELINAMLDTGKEVFLSTDNFSDFYWPSNYDYSSLRALYCIPSYPTKLSDFRMKSITFNQDRDSFFDGISDHSIGLEASMVAISRGARIIEKHFTISRSDRGPDQICSIEPTELKKLVKFARAAEEIIW